MHTIGGFKVRQLHSTHGAGIAGLVVIVGIIQPE